MKKHNQIERKNSRGSSTSQGKKPKMERIRVPMPLALKEAVERGARKLSISPSKFLEQAIREQLPRVEVAIVKSRRVARDIMISKRRADVLSRLALELRADPKEIGENAIESYLLFIEKRPDLAEAQPRFVARESVFAISAAGDLYDRLDHACEIYDLDRNSVVDSAVGAYLDMVLRHEDGSSAREFLLSCRGSSDPENIECALSQAGANVRSMFDKLVGQISAQPFAQACAEFSALRELTMHHPSLKKEREALEMIAEGAARLE
jgi:predicted transcriptional regulator